MNGRILVLNCHEAWVHQLRLLGKPLDIVVGLPGRHIRGWDETIRPVPERSRLISLQEAAATPEPYDCIITHNLSDLLDTKNLPGPRILVIHLMLEGMILEQQAQTRVEDYRRAVKEYTERARVHVVAVSAAKRNSWGFAKNIVPLTADPEEYLPWTGDLASGLRVSNFILRRGRTLLWDFHNLAFAGLPVTLVGHNPEIPGVRASWRWTELKEILRRHRFFVHTAEPRLEDGYNMATLEAMAAGLPVLGNRHPSSPVIHGVNGFLSDDPVELNALARGLLADRELAGEMGRAARQTVLEQFSGEAFRASMLEAIRTAQATWRTEGSCFMGGLSSPPASTVRK
jgi:glycosyltransferase involved in cell wall biosynthesis